MRKEVLCSAETETIQKVSGLLKNLDVVVMTTLNENGRMHSRPMLLQKNDFDGRLWFFTNDASQKVAELRWNRQVHLIGFDSKTSRYIAISGTGCMTRDRDRMRKLWNAEHQKWFTRGLFDPDLVLIEVQVDRVETWEPEHQEIYVLRPFSAEPLAG